MRFAYADPPYPGTAHRYPENQEIDHWELIERLNTFDGWALHTNTQSVGKLLGMAPMHTRLLAWCKGDGLPVTKEGLVYTWEPVLLVPCRPPRIWVRDSLFHNRRIAMEMRGQKSPWDAHLRQSALPLEGVS